METHNGDNCVMQKIESYLCLRRSFIDTETYDPEMVYISEKGAGNGFCTKASIVSHLNRIGGSILELRLDPPGPAERQLEEELIDDEELEDDEDLEPVKKLEEIEDE